MSASFLSSSRDGSQGWSWVEPPIQEVGRAAPIDRPARLGGHEPAGARLQGQDSEAGDAVECVVALGIADRAELVVLADARRIGDDDHIARRYRVEHDDSLAGEAGIEEFRRWSHGAAQGEGGGGIAVAS